MRLLLWLLWWCRRFRPLLRLLRLPHRSQRLWWLLRLWKLRWPRLSLWLSRLLPRRKLLRWLPRRWLRLRQRRKSLLHRLCLCARL